MTKAKITIEFDTREQAEENVNNVHQLFMQRNPLDEPYIEIVEISTENAQMSRWWHHSETRSDTEFKIKCSQCGSDGFINNIANETINIECTNTECYNTFNIYSKFE